MARNGASVDIPVDKRVRSSLPKPLFKELTSGSFAFLSKHLNVPFDFNLLWLNSIIVKRVREVWTSSLKTLCHSLLNKDGNNRWP